MLMEGRALLFRVRCAGGRWIRREAERLVQQFEQSGTGWSGNRFARCGALPAQAGPLSVRVLKRRASVDGTVGAVELAGSFPSQGSQLRAAILCGAQQRFQTEALCSSLSAVCGGTPLLAASRYIAVFLQLQA